MPFPTTGSNTELQAVNQILASVGQAPVTTLTTEETLVLSETSRFTGYINGTTLYTSKSDLTQGSYIGGTGVEDNTSIATTRAVFTPNASAAGTTLTSTSAFIPKGVSISSSTITIPVTVDSGPTDVGGGNFEYTISTATTATAADLTLSPIYYNHTLNINHGTNVGNTVTQASLTQSNVTSRVETQTNPDVAIALNTLREVSREVQSEGWSFNREYDYKITPDSNNEVQIANNVLQMDLNRNYTQNIGRDSINRGGKLYDKKAHSYKWTDETLYVDITWYFDWANIPQPIQAFIVARAAGIVSSRIIGDPNQYQMLQQKEAYARAMAMEYECNQEDVSFFGSPKSGDYYQPYQPFHTLIR
jgi:hypothetical protein